LYGAQPAPAPDTALLAQRSVAQPQQEDTILPLARGVSSYGFTVPPADVQAKIQAAKPKPVSDLTMMSRISRHVPLASKASLKHKNRWVNLEKEFKTKSIRRVKPRHVARKFHLSTHKKHKQHHLAPALNSKQLKEISHQSANPFSENLEKSQFDAASSPAFLAFSEQSRVVEHSDAESSSESDSESDSESEHEQNAAQESETEDFDAAMLEESAQTEPARASDYESENRAVPSANFQKMFRSIMNHQRKRRDE